MPIVLLNLLVDIPGNQRSLRLPDNEIKKNCGENAWWWCDLLFIDISILHVQGVFGKESVAIQRHFDVGWMRYGIGDQD